MFYSTLSGFHGDGKGLESWPRFVGAHRFRGLSHTTSPGYATVVSLMVAASSFELGRFDLVGAYGSLLKNA
jgi:hypothetical protein